MVHILCELRDSHGITTARLKECDQPIRRQILPADRLQILDEVYRVREEEQKFIDGVSGPCIPFIAQLPLRLTGLIDGEQPVLISRTNLPQPAEDSCSSHSSPTRADSSRNIAESDCSGSPAIGPSQVPSVEVSTVSGYNPSDIYSTLHLSSNIQYQPTESSTSLSTSPSDSKRKRESSGLHLVDRTRHFDAAQFSYENPAVQPTPMEFFVTPNVSPVNLSSLPTPQPFTESSSTEPMIPYAHPYFFNY